MAKKKKDKEIVGVAVSVTPVVEERDNKKSGGAMTEKNTWEKTSIEKKKRYGMKEGGKGIEALKKVAPEVVERMGYEEGGDIDAQMAMMMPTEEEPMMETDLEEEALGTGLADGMAQQAEVAADKDAMEEETLEEEDLEEEKEDEGEEEEEEQSARTVNTAPTTDYNYSHRRQIYPTRP